MQASQLHLSHSYSQESYQNYQLPSSYAPQPSQYTPFQNYGVGPISPTPSSYHTPPSRYGYGSVSRQSSGSIPSPGGTLLGQQVYQQGYGQPSYAGVDIEIAKNYVVQIPPWLDFRIERRLVNEGNIYLNLKYLLLEHFILRTPVNTLMLEVQNIFQGTNMDILYAIAYQVPPQIRDLYDIQLDRILPDYQSQHVVAQTLLIPPDSTVPGSYSQNSYVEQSALNFLLKCQGHIGPQSWPMFYSAFTRYFMGNIELQDKTTNNMREILVYLHNLPQLYNEFQSLFQVCAFSEYWCGLRKAGLGFNQSRQQSSSSQSQSIGQSQSVGSSRKGQFNVQAAQKSLTLQQQQGVYSQKLYQQKRNSGQLDVLKPKMQGSGSSGLQNSSGSLNQQFSASSNQSEQTQQVPQVQQKRVASPQKPVASPFLSQQPKGNQAAAVEQLQQPQNKENIGMQSSASLNNLLGTSMSSVSLNGGIGGQKKHGSPVKLPPTNLQAADEQTKQDADAAQQAQSAIEKEQKVQQQKLNDQDSLNSQQQATIDIEIEADQSTLSQQNLQQQKEEEEQQQQRQQQLQQKILEADIVESQSLNEQLQSKINEIILENNKLAEQNKELEVNVNKTKVLSQQQRLQNIVQRAKQLNQKAQIPTGQQQQTSQQPTSLQQQTSLNSSNDSVCKDNDIQELEINVKGRGRAQKFEQSWRYQQKLPHIRQRSPKMGTQRRPGDFQVSPKRSAIDMQIEVLNQPDITANTRASIIENDREQQVNFQGLSNTLSDNKPLNLSREGSKEGSMTSQSPRLSRQTSLVSALKKPGESKLQSRENKLFSQQSAQGVDGQKASVNTIKSVTFNPEAMQKEPRSLTANQSKLSTLAESNLYTLSTMSTNFNFSRQKQIPQGQDPFLVKHRSNVSQLSDDTRVRSSLMNSMEAPKPAADTPSQASLDIAMKNGFADSLPNSYEKHPSKDNKLLNNYGSRQSSYEVQQQQQQLLHKSSTFGAEEFEMEMTTNNMDMTQMDTFMLTTEPDVSGALTTTQNQLFSNHLAKSQPEVSLDEQQLHEQFIKTVINTQRTEMTQNVKPELGTDVYRTRDSQELAPIILNPEDPLLHQQTIQSKLQTFQARRLNGQTGTNGSNQNQIVSQLQSNWSQGFFTQKLTSGLGQYFEDQEKAMIRTPSQKLKDGRLSKANSLKGPPSGLNTIAEGQASPEEESFPEGEGGEGGEGFGRQTSLGGRKFGRYRLPSMGNSNVEGLMSQSQSRAVTYSQKLKSQLDQDMKFLQTNEGNDMIKKYVLNSGYNSKLSTLNDNSLAGMNLSEISNISLQATQYVNSNQEFTELSRVSEGEDSGLKPTDTGLTEVRQLRRKSRDLDIASTMSSGELQNELVDFGIQKSQSKIKGITSSFVSGELSQERPQSRMETRDIHRGNSASSEEDYVSLTDRSRSKGVSLSNQQSKEIGQNIQNIYDSQKSKMEQFQQNKKAHTQDNISPISSILSSLGSGEMPNHLNFLKESGGLRSGEDTESKVPVSDSMLDSSMNRLLREKLKQAQKNGIGSQRPGILDKLVQYHMGKAQEDRNISPGADISPPQEPRSPLSPLSPLSRKSWRKSVRVEDTQNQQETIQTPSFNMNTTSSLTLDIKSYDSNADKEPEPKSNIKEGSERGSRGRGDPDGSARMRKSASRGNFSLREAHDSFELRPSYDQNSSTNSGQVDQIIVGSENDSGTNHSYSKSLRENSGRSRRGIVENLRNRIAQTNEEDDGSNTGVNEEDNAIYLGSQHTQKSGSKSFTENKHSPKGQQISNKSRFSNDENAPAVNIQYSASGNSSATYFSAQQSVSRKSSNRVSGDRQSGDKNRIPDSKDNQVLIEAKGEEQVMTGDSKVQGDQELQKISSGKSQKQDDVDYNEGTRKSMQRKHAKIVRSISLLSQIQTNRKSVTIQTLFETDQDHERLMNKINLGLSESTLSSEKIQSSHYTQNNLSNLNTNAPTSQHNNNSAIPQWVNEKVDNSINNSSQQQSISLVDNQRQSTMFKNELREISETFGQMQEEQNPQKQQKGGIYGLLNDYHESQQHLITTEESENQNIDSAANVDIPNQYARNHAPTLMPNMQFLSKTQNQKLNTHKQPKTVKKKKNKIVKTCGNIKTGSSNNNKDESSGDY